MEIVKKVIILILLAASGGLAITFAVLSVLAVLEAL